MPIDALVLQSDAPDRWEQALYAFLAEKERRSGCVRTVQSYSRMLRYFFGKLAKPPDAVRPADVLAYAHGVGLSGKEPSAITIGAHTACVSSFFKFLIRMELLERNPCDALERPKTPQSTPRGLSAAEVQRLLAIIPDTPVGKRDRAIVLTLLLTGRRRSEVLNLTVGDIEPGEPAFYRYRGKGGKQGRRELPRPAYVACVSALSAFDREAGHDGARGVDLAHVRPHRRRVQRHGLRQLPALPGCGGSPARWAAHSAPQRGEAAPRCGGIDRGREPLLGPFDAGCHDDVSAALGRRAGRGLAAGRRHIGPRDQLIRMGAIATILPPICTARPDTGRIGAA